MCAGARGAPVSGSACASAWDVSWAPACPARRQWGSVCGYDPATYDSMGSTWDDSGAAVACQQLADSSASAGVVQWSAVMPGDAAVPKLPWRLQYWLGPPRCSGAEASLVECTNGWGRVPAECGPSDAVGVRCVLRL